MPFAGQSDAACLFPKGVTAKEGKMNSIFEREQLEFQVVINDKGQYSVWPLDWNVPAGWTGVGVTGPRDDCLKHIESIWTDMRPRSAVFEVPGMDNS